jgi:DNA-binding transcriptional regulator LsrR (DeoR family)
MARPQGTRETPDVSQMRQVATLFYEDNLSKQTIGKRLGIDPRKVAWLLDKARKSGLVKITIEQSGQSDLEEPLKQKFPHLKKVMIVSGGKVSTPDQYAGFLKRSALVAAEYFDELVTAQAQQKRRELYRAIITGGETQLEFANAVKDLARPNLYIYPAALVGRGRLSGAASHVDAIVNAAILWSRSGRLPGHCDYPTVPPYQIDKPGPEARREIANQLAAIAESAPIRDAFKDVTVDNIAIALSSIGTLKPGNVDAKQRARITATGVMHSFVSPKTLEDEGAVGDMAYSLFDAEGNGQKKWSFFISAGHYDEDRRRHGLGFYKAMVQAAKPVIVAAGPYKIGAIKAALKGKLFNVLITDGDSAGRLAEAD